MNSEINADEMFEYNNVFDIYDIVKQIFDNLSCFEIESLNVINKTCYEVYKNVFKRKCKEELYDPFDENFKTIIEVSNHYKFSPHTIRPNEIKQMYNSLENICYTYWIVLVHDLNRMEELFMTCSSIEPCLRLIGSTCFSNIEKTRTLLCRYLFIEYPDKYKLEDLRLLAKYKGVKRWYNKKRSHLVRDLRRPKDQLYYIDGTVA